jgi:hypothetical protein
MSRGVNAPLRSTKLSVCSAILWLFLLMLPSAASADELVFATEAERLEYQNWVVSGGRQAWLYLVEGLMVPCFQNRHRECRDNMVTALRSVPDSVRNARVTVGARTERLLFAVRNNQFLYQTAFSVRALRAIVEEGGDCAQWESRAAAFIGSTTGALQRLRNEAGTDIGSRTRLPEARELRWVDAQLVKGGCGITLSGD